MNTLIIVFYRICLLRLGPQDLPRASFLVGLTTVAMMLSGSMLVAADGGLELSGMLAVILDMGLTALLVRLALGVVGHVERFNQTLSALYGSGTLIQIVTLPVLLLIGEDPNTSAISQLAVLFFIAILIWSFIVSGHILRHALDVPLWAGTGLAVVYWVVASDLLRLLGLI